MRKLIMTAILFMGLGTMAFAQQDSVQSKGMRRHHPRVQQAQQTPEERAQKITDALSTKLALTADQKSKIYAINLESAKKAQAKREAHMAEMKKEREAMRADLKNRDHEITSVLNEDQLKAYQELKKERIDHMKKRFRPGHGKWQGKKAEQEG